LLYQSLTGHWESWAYVWSLYPVFLGAALIFVGRRTGDNSKVSVGDGFVKWGLFGFVGLWIFFELLIFGGRSQLVSTVVPLALIAAGIFMLSRRNSGQSSPRKVKPVNGHRPSQSDPLQDKIDAALADDDEVIV